MLCKMCSYGVSVYLDIRGQHVIYNIYFFLLLLLVCFFLCDWISGGSVLNVLTHVVNLLVTSCNDSKAPVARTCGQTCFMVRFHCHDSPLPHGFMNCFRSHDNRC